MSKILALQFIIFALVYPFIWLISILPFRVLYFLSDLFYYLIYYIIGYRKKTVIANLTHAFPEKTEVEIKAITKKFFKHFTDIFVELIKSFTISNKEISKRYQFTNVDIIHKLESQNRSSILLGAHNANWEWIFSLNLQIGFTGIGFYKVLKNKYFDKKVRDTRGRYNTALESTKKVFDIMEHNKKHNILTLYGFLGDQSPRAQKAHYWSEFLGVNVPIYTGFEMLAKKYDLPVVIFNTKKIKRGYYISDLQLLTDEPNSFNNYEITDRYLRELEKYIRETPEHYFWTHKRFKHRDKAPKS